MFDRPEVVIFAIQEMVAASRASREPQPLPPSETDKPAGDELFQGPGASESPLQATPNDEGLSALWNR